MSTFSCCFQMDFGSTREMVVWVNLERVQPSRAVGVYFWLEGGDRVAGGVNRAMTTTCLPTFPHHICPGSCRDRDLLVSGGSWEIINQRVVQQHNRDCLWCTGGTEVIHRSEAPGTDRRSASVRTSAIKEVGRVLVGWRLFAVFADDPKPSCSGCDVKQGLNPVQRDVLAFKTWFDLNKLSLNKNNVSGLWCVWKIVTLRWTWMKVKLGKFKTESF